MARVRKRRKETTRPLPLFASFPPAYMDALDVIIKEVKTAKTEFTVHVRLFTPKGVPGGLGRKITTGEEAERRNIQRFLQVARKPETLDIPNREGRMKPFHKLLEDWNIRVKTKLTEHFDSGQLSVVTELIVAPNLTKLLARAVNLAAQEDN